MTGSAGEAVVSDKGRVLIVDDEPDLRDACAEFLEEAGYAVATAGDGLAAMNLLWTQRFDVVLSDIVMPDMNGIQLLRAVRERDLDVPVVLMTADPRVETAVQALDLGALKYLIKPVKEGGLLAAVENAVRLHGIARLKREAAAHLGAEDKQVGDRAGLESRFARALDSLWMAYQPIVRAGDGHIVAHEALVRSAEPSLPRPGALFDAAERLRRVPEVGRVVRDSVAAFLQGAGGGGTDVFVNLHAQDLADESLFSPAAALSKKAKSVVLEITERASLDGVPGIRKRIQRLRDLGFRIAVDDLGAGYAGLNTLAALEPDVAKLDMALVRGVNAEPVKRRIVGSIAALCKELGMTVVAEGVETAAERDTLVEMGCDLLQGYFFGRPSGRGSP